MTDIAALEPDVTEPPIVDPPPKSTKSGKLFDEYLMECSAIGQLDQMLSRLDSDQRNLEKRLEVKKAAAKSKFSQYQKVCEEERIEQAKKVNNENISAVS